MKRFGFLAVVAALALGGCAGLEQFPKVSKDYATDLEKLDNSYFEALKAINATKDQTEQKRIRNEEIERRLPIIDLNFAKYETALAKENVQVDFGIALAGIGVGAVGAFVTETASQVLSAASAGLAGGQAAYRKAALFDQAFPALLAQMRATRNQVRVKVYEGMTRSYAEYPLSMAIVDLNEYIFAGSIPGAIAGTAKDAEAKNDRAEMKLDELKSSTFSEDENAKKISAFIWPPDGDRTNPPNQANLTKLRDWMKANKIDGLAIQKLLDNPALKEERENAIRDIPIP